MFRQAVRSGRLGHRLLASSTTARFFSRTPAVFPNTSSQICGPTLCDWNVRRSMCSVPGTSEKEAKEKAAILSDLSPERLELLQGLFLSSGADDFDSSITCKHLENTLLKLVGGEEDPVTHEIIHKIVSTADIDNNKVISWAEFCQWFEPLTDDNLSLRSLFEYWSMNSELKNPKVIFNNAWSSLKSQYGEENLNFPSQLLCLGGAPGSGKGTNTPFILREREISATPIVMSSLLRSPAMQKIKAQGGLVGDYEVLKTLLQELLKPAYRNGAVVDGFPRTAIQVEFLRMLRDHMVSLQQKYAGTELEEKFQRPAFRMIVLYVNETESVRRQLARGKRTEENNEKVKQTGLGEVKEVRSTDISVAAARKRYKVFSEQALEALQSLKQEFPYHVIDASGSVEDVEKEIIQELSYQSSMELKHETYEAIRPIPTAKNIVSNARQQLVQRLDAYQHSDKEMFHSVIEAIHHVFIPVFRRHALSGACRVVMHDDEIYFAVINSEKAVSMIVDILADRDFSVIGVERKEYGIMFDVRFRTRGLH